MDHEGAGAAKCPRCGELAERYAGDRICKRCRREQRRKSYYARIDKEKAKATARRLALAELVDRHRAEFFELLLRYERVSGPE